MMVLFGVAFEDIEKVRPFLEDIRKNYQKVNLINGNIYIVGHKAFFHIQPILFKLWLLAIPIWLFGFVFFGFFNIKVLLIGLIPFSTILFWIDTFYYLAFLIGMRKNMFKVIYKKL